MKLVTAVIQPHRLDEVKQTLMANGVKGMTATQVNGYGRQRGHTEVYRGAEYTVDLLPKVKIEVVCADDEARPIALAIAEAARSGRIGDGKIWITTLDEVIRVRTGESGEEAL
ncbi:P-II family nitrogen regulator [Arcanobacterium haemolyticum]|nr:P-II family nitrogen regulator [Arcanobacterium haemolyticum]